jgi:hypothetical protein
MTSAQAGTAKGAAARGAEEKPAWRAVPKAVRAEAERRLGARVRRAVRTWGGYAPSATFRLALTDGRSVFFKAAYPVPEDSPVRFVVDREARVYRSLHHLIAPWAPDFYGSFALDGWQCLLLEDLGATTVPPWTPAKARAALGGYGAFHRASVGRALPRWLPRHSRRAGFNWQRLQEVPEGLVHLAALAGDRRREAADWLATHVGEIDQAAQALSRVRGPYAIVHRDTRSDNVRVHPGAAVPLRIFDWPDAAAGPPELDLMIFAQSIVCEGGPPPEELVRWYAAEQPVRERVLVLSAAAVAGFFALRAWQPEVPALPRLRSVQRQQLRASLRWAAQLLALPDPTWLDAVPP